MDFRAEAEVCSKFFGFPCRWRYLLQVFDNFRLNAPAFALPRADPAEKRASVPISKTIKVRIDYSRESHADYALFVAGIVKNPTGNPHLPKPPMDLAVLKALLERYRES